MKSVLEGDQLVTLRIASDIVIATRRLDRAFQRFRARIGEEDGIGKRVVHDALREGLTLRRTIEIGDMHQRGSLIRNRLDEMRMAMAQRVHGNARREVQVALASLADQVTALTAHRTHITPGINGHERGDRHELPPNLMHNRRRRAERPN